MNNSFRILPLAMWAGGISLPVYGLQVRIAPLPGAMAATAGEYCGGTTGTPLASQAVLQCHAAELAEAYDPWHSAAVVPAAALRTRYGTADGSDALAAAHATQVGQAGSAARGAAPWPGDPGDPADLLARTRLNAAHSREARSGWVGQMLAGLATVGLVARRRLAWRARSPGPFAPHRPGLPPPAAAATPHPPPAPVHRPAKRSRAAPAAGERQAV